MEDAKTRREIGRYGRIKLTRAKRHRLYMDSHLRRRGRKASNEAEFSSTMIFVVTPSLLGLLFGVMAFFRSRNSSGNMTDGDEVYGEVGQTLIYASGDDEVEEDRG